MKYESKLIIKGYDLISYRTADQLLSVWRNSKDKSSIVWISMVYPIVIQRTNEPSAFSKGKVFLSGLDRNGKPSSVYIKFRANELDSVNEFLCDLSIANADCLQRKAAKEAAQAEKHAELERMKTRLEDMRKQNNESLEQIEALKLRVSDNMEKADQPSKIEVVGTHYTNAEQILKNIVKDQGGIWNVGGFQEHEIDLALIPEPENEYDSNAIMVVSKHETPPRARIQRSGKLGYLPKDSGVELDQPKQIKAIIKEGFGKFYIKIDLDGL